MNEATKIPAWIDLSKLPGGDQETIRRRIQCGMRGRALATLLARWTLDARALKEQPDFGVDDSSLRVALESHLGFADIDLATFLVTEIDEMLGAREDDDERFERWVESRPEVFGDKTPDLSLLLFSRETAVQTIELLGGEVTWPVEDEEVAR